MATDRELMPRRGVRRGLLVERIASWSARHRAVVVLGWLAFVAALVFAGQAVGTSQLGTNQAIPGEAERAGRMLSRAGVSDPISESVLIQDAGGRRTVDDPALQGAIRDVVATLGRFPGTAVQIRSPLEAANGRQISRDRRSALVTFVVDRPEVGAAYGLLKLVFQSAASSPSWACLTRPVTTAACWPCSPTCEADGTCRAGRRRERAGSAPGGQADAASGLVQRPAGWFSGRRAGRRRRRCWSAGRACGWPPGRCSP